VSQAIQKQNVTLTAEQDGIYRRQIDTESRQPLLDKNHALARISVFQVNALSMLIALFEHSSSRKRVVF
jgi:hypothetical protein